MDNNDDFIYRPVIYKTEEDARIANKKMTVIDAAKFMRPELAKIKKHEISKDYPCNLVYYPWLDCYVTCLQEEDFITVRTNRNKNKITQDEQAVFNHKTVGIIGQSTGSHLAYILAHERLCGHLKLAENDTLNLSNLNRIRGGIAQIGLPKNVIIARAIAELDPYLTVDIYNHHITSENMGEFMNESGKIDLMVDACDDMKTKFLLRFVAKANKIPLLMETNDRGRIDIERFDTIDPPIFHGLMGDIDESKFLSMEHQEIYKKIQGFLMNSGGLSKKMLHSLPLIGKELQSFPQLATETVLGASVLATCIRRIFLNEMTYSGVFFIDIEQIIDELE